MGIVIDIVRSIRNARAEAKVDPGRFIEATVSATDARPAIEAQSAAISTLARVRPLTVVDRSANPVAPDNKAKVLVLKGAEVVLPLEGMVDIDAEKSRVQGDIDATLEEIERAERLLADDAFVSKAPSHVVEKQRQKLDEHRDRLAKLQERAAELG